MLPRSRALAMNFKAWCKQVSHQKGAGSFLLSSYNKARKCLRNRHVDLFRITVIVMIVMYLLFFLHRKSYSPSYAPCKVAYFLPNDSVPSYADRIMMLSASRAMLFGNCIDLYVYQSQHTCRKGKCIKELARALGLGPLYINTNAIRLKLMPDGFPNLQLYGQYDMFVEFGSPQQVFPRHPAGAGRVNYFFWQYDERGEDIGGQGAVDVGGPADVERLAGYEHVVMGSEYRYNLYLRVMEDTYVQQNQRGVVMPTPHVLKPAFILKSEKKKKKTKKKATSEVSFDDDAPSAPLLNSFNEHCPPFKIVVFASDSPTRFPNTARSSRKSPPSTLSEQIAADITQFYVSNNRSGRFLPSLDLHVVLPGTSARHTAPWTNLLASVTGKISVTLVQNALLADVEELVFAGSPLVWVLHSDVSGLSGRAGGPAHRTGSGRRPVLSTTLRNDVTTARARRANGAVLSAGLFDPWNSDDMENLLVAAMGWGSTPLVVHRNLYREGVRTADRDPDGREVILRRIQNRLNGYIVNTTSELLQETMDLIMVATDQQKTAMKQLGKDAMARYHHGEFWGRATDLFRRGIRAHHVHRLVREKIADLRTIPLRMSTPAAAQHMAVIVEPAFHAFFEFAVRNTARFLGGVGEGWGMTVYHSAENAQFVKETTRDVLNVQFIELAAPLLHEDDHHQLLKQPSFWQPHADKKRVLVFTSDSMMLRKGINEFMGHDFIAAPWDVSSNEPVRQAISRRDFTSNVGDGGFSLRAGNVTYELALRYGRCSKEAEQEDMFFLKYLERHGHRVASNRTACRFAVGEGCNLSNLSALHNGRHGQGQRFHKEGRSSSSGPAGSPGDGGEADAGLPLALHAAWNYHDPREINYMIKAAFEF